MLCAIYYHFYNLKNVKNTHGGVLLFVKLQAVQFIKREKHSLRGVTSVELLQASAKQVGLIESLNIIKSYEPIRLQMISG